MNSLSYMEKLLDGVKVEWKPLGLVTDYEQPTKYLVTSTNYSDASPSDWPRGCPLHRPKDK